MDTSDTEDVSSPEIESLLGWPFDICMKLFSLRYARSLMTVMSMPEKTTNMRLTDMTQIGIEKVTSIGCGQSNDISAALLRQIIFYSYRPDNYLDFASPRLINGCFILMSEISKSISISPFSCELGYTCFRILALGLGVCLFRQGQDLGYRQALYLPNFKGLDIHQMTLYIIPLVNQLVSATNDREDRDNCILGWCECKEHREFRRIISHVGAEGLLTLLYEHRLSFLQAMRFTYSPGLSTVIFVLWRYIEFQRPLNDESLAKKRLDSFREVFWRCWLVATHDQVVFQHMAKRFPVNCQYPNTGQGVAPTPVDLEDSYELIEAFIDRLTPPVGDTSFYDRLSVTDLISCIEFMQHHMVPGVEELLAPCFGAIIERLWYTISCPKDSATQMSEVLGIITTWFRGIEGLYQRASDPNPEALIQLIDEMIRTDFLSLVARTIFTLNPTMDQGRNSVDFGRLISLELIKILAKLDKLANNAKFLRGTEGFFGNISKALPTQILADRFRDQGADWWKVNDHVEYLALVAMSKVNCGSNGTLLPQVRFYDTCSGVWKSIGKCIQHTAENVQYVSACGYRRCPDPIIDERAVHECSECRRIQYCSAQCQAL